MPSPVKALLDANVLYSNHLRNLLLQLAQNDLFDARWSERIEQEWLRNMEPLTRERIASSTIPLIRTWFTDALVVGFDPERVIGATHSKTRMARREQSTASHFYSRSRKGKKSGCGDGHKTPPLKRPPLS
jgi:hypothetical protein